MWPCPGLALASLPQRNVGRRRRHVAAAQASFAGVEQENACELGDDKVASQRLRYATKVRMGEENWKPKIDSCMRQARRLPPLSTP